jgi:capsular exopolysaccharide synthesis family protein
MSRTHEAWQRAELLKREKALKESAAGTSVPVSDLPPDDHVPDLPLQAPTVAAVQPREEIPAAIVVPAAQSPLFGDESGAELGSALGEQIVTHPDADPVLVDQFRKLAVAIHHAQLEHGVRTVSVTSAVASEGKTLTAINLALTLAASYQRRVLLVDADLRRPSLHDWLKLPRTPGLTDAIASKHPNALPVVQLMPGVSVLTAGSRTRDPVNTLSSEPFRRLLLDAALAYDLLILDMPPVGALPDTSLVAGASDTTVFVVQAGMADYTVVQRAVEAIGPDRIIGVALNMVSPEEFDSTYGYLGHYAEDPPDNGGLLARLRRLF